MDVILKFTVLCLAALEKTFAIIVFWPVRDLRSSCVSSSDSLCRIHGLCLPENNKKTYLK
jgi:hypothetical protein